MKNIIKLTCLLLTVCGFAGCTGNFDEYNTDPYALYKGDPAVLIPTMLDAMMYVQQNDSQMVDQMVGSLGGYFTLSNRWGGQNFDTFNASDAWNATPYNTMFEDIYANFFDIEKSTSKSGHYYAMARLVRAAVMMRVADCYGPIPYSKVADGSFYVEYDSAEDVYKHIIEDLAGAATTLYAYAQEYPASKPLANNDPIFAGDYTAWARLANSLCLRAAIRSNDREAAAQRAFEDALMQKVADGIQADIPDEMVDVQAQQMMENFQQQLAAQGIPFDQYLAMTGMTMDIMREQAKAAAVQQVRMDLAVAALVKAENLEATAQEIEDELKTVADKYGMDLDTIKKYLPEADVREQVLRSKAIKAVADAAVAVAPVVEESQEEARQEEEKKDAE